MRRAKHTSSGMITSTITSNGLCSDCKVHKASIVVAAMANEWRVATDLLWLARLDDLPRVELVKLLGIRSGNA